MKKVFIAFSFLSTTLSFAQTTSPKIGLTKGQTVEVVTNTNISAQTMMGPSSGTISSSDVYSVNDATENGITLVKVPKQIKMNFSMGSQEMKVDSDNPKDLTSMFGQPVKEIMSQKPEFTIDANGKVIALKLDGKKKKDDQSGANIMGMMLPGMDFSAAIPQEGSPSIFQVLPARNVAVGDTWTDSTDIKDNKNITTYKVRNITDKEIILDFAGNGSNISSQAAGGMKVEVNATTATTGNIIIDKATRIIKQKTTTSTTESAINVAGRDITSTIKSTSVTNFNLK